MAKSKISPTLRLFIEQRAGSRCEYCKAPVVFMPHPFTIDHVLPFIMGGSDEVENLAYACFGCNRCKHNKTTAVDPFTLKEVPLFNPRIHTWNEHFNWDAKFTQVLGLTSIGRATVTALKLNRKELIRMRKELIEVNRHPPKEDIFI